ncbi:MAG: HflC protein [Roseibacillus sp.]|nr:HflC protein [Roseibacillus sp.]MBB81983.1 HflC protein [Roseibacillus sp.]|tara:strand:+ start:594 stop:1583 length:990 start_codon:yes stop_codon:yes gene_type:complete
MNQKYLAGCFTLIVVAIGLIVLSGAAYTVNMREQVVITQFGKPKGKPITEAGLKFKIPFIQKANVFDKRILPWDGPVSQMPTKEKTLIMVDTYARWQISDPLTFLRLLRDERTASSRLNDILGSETRNTIAKHELIEVIRTTQGRVPEQSEVIVEGDTTGVVGVLPPISRGRSALERDIYETSKIKLEMFGIKLLDIRFKRVNYNQTVEGQIYQRMISERKQIADRFRSEGAGEAAKILGKMEKELNTIESEAYKQVQTIMGNADAEATEIYASAYNQSPEAAEFYEFSKTMELYPEMIGGKSTVVLSTDSDLFKYLKGMQIQDENEEE